MKTINSWDEIPEFEDPQQEHDFWLEHEIKTLSQRRLVKALL